MKSDKHADGEPAGRMVNNNGHWEYVYDDAQLNPPRPPERRPATPTEPKQATPLASTIYQPAQLRARRDGWTAERQRRFLTTLAETGSVSRACVEAGVSSRSAYRLRAHPLGATFADAWDAALKLATARLTALAFERATRGTVREVWRDGQLVQTTRQPSDKLLMFLLQHLLPAGRPGERWGGFEAMTASVRDSFPEALASLVDRDTVMVDIDSRDFFDDEPGCQDEDV